MSNLPPGVTESMLPGNRPEDLAEEKFWDDLYAQLEAEGIVLPEGWDALGSDGNLVRLVEITREIAWRIGFDEGKADIDIPDPEEF